MPLRDRSETESLFTVGRQKLNAGIRRVIVFAMQQHAKRKSKDSGHFDEGVLLRCQGQNIVSGSSFESNDNPAGVLCFTSHF